MVVKPKVCTQSQVTYVYNDIYRRHFATKKGGSINRCEIDKNLNALQVILSVSNAQETKLIQWSPLNRILFKGIFWLMEYNFKVQNRLYSFIIVINLLKGILFKGIFWINE